MTVYVRANRLELYCSYCDYPHTVVARAGQLLTVADLADAEHRHSGRHAVEQVGDEPAVDIAAPSPLAVVSGPQTMAAVGEVCVVCDEPFDQGNVSVFVICDSRAGVAHEDCVGGFANPAPSRRQRAGGTGRASR